MMSKLAANDDGTNKQFRLKIYHSKRNYQNRYRSNSGDRRIQFSGRIQYGQTYRVYSCLIEKEKKEVMDMLYKYKEAFSLGDKIGTCPNIEVEIDVMDKSPFFIRPYNVKEEDKKFIDKEMKCLCYLGILKEGFLAYSSPVMLISRKIIQDKSVVTDFRHLNVRIAKNNLAYPSLKDTFSVLGNSRYEVLLL